MPVTLSMASFKNVQDDATGLQFFRALETAGGIFIPEFVEIEGKGEVPYQPGHTDGQRSAWKSYAVLLKRQSPVEVIVTLTKGDETLLKVMPNTLNVTIDDAYFQSNSRLSELLDLGEALYSILSPCYGYVELPWLPGLTGIVMPHLGLPGWGWATWLGPEYNDIVRVQSEAGVSIRAMPDGGRCVVLPTPSRGDQPDRACIEGYIEVVRSLDPSLFQPRRPLHPARLPAKGFEQEFIGLLHNLAQTHSGPQQNVKVPRFRFRNA